MPRNTIPDFLIKVVEAKPDSTLTSKIRMGEVPGVVFGFTGTRMSKATAYNWARKGTSDCSGRNIRLKTYKVVNTLHTTKSDVKTFLEAIDGGHDDIK